MFNPNVRAKTKPRKVLQEKLSPQFYFFKVVLIPEGLVNSKAGQSSSMCRLLVRISF